MFLFPRLNPWITTGIVIGVLVVVALGADGLLRWLSIGAIVLYVLAFLGDSLWS